MKAEVTIEITIIEDHTTDVPALLADLTKPGVETTVEIGGYSFDGKVKRIVHENALAHPTSIDDCLWR